MEASSWSEGPCRRACATGATMSEQASCQGACVAHGWSSLQDFSHKAPRWLARRQQRLAANRTATRRGRRSKSGGSSGGAGSSGGGGGGSSGFTATWTEGLQLQAEYNASLSLRDACAFFFADDVPARTHTPDSHATARTGP